MGCADPAWIQPGDGEDPVREVSIDAFEISARAVTNTEFGEFVSATGYVTEAEKYAWSFVFGGLLPDDFPPTRGVEQAPWWRQVMGATWSAPEGPHSDISGRGNHPVVQVTWNDAQAYCSWSGTRLPTEAEWEFAARGGLSQKIFPWGDDLEPEGEHRMNVWQGVFPNKNTLADGWLGTCPVDEYEPNGYGLYNTTGNVWEWCEGEPGEMKPTRGGSYLCHESYCRRYRVAARSIIGHDTSIGNVGFRVAR